MVGTKGTHTASGSGRLHQNDAKLANGDYMNYHASRWTNAAVEGRNNRMKAYQRRHYFTRNRERYVQGLLVEFNRERFGT